MKLKKVICFLFLLTPVLSNSQIVSIYPSHLPNYIYDVWVNSKNEITLIISKDYIVINNDLYGYNNIVQENFKLDFTCVNNPNNDIKYISISKVNDNSIFLDEGFKISKLYKLPSSNLKNIPRPLIDKWYSEDSKIELKKNVVLFSGVTSKIDYVATSNYIDYKIIVYNNGEYTLLHNYINDNGHYIDANLIKTVVFKKASFYKKYKNELFAFSLLFVALLSYVIVYWKIKISKKRETSKRLFIEMQLKSIRSQMNPHFLFNALSAIQNLINKGDNEQANHYLTEFSQLMRLTLDKSEKGVVPLFDEIESIKKYLEIEKLRFYFDYQIITDNNIDSNSVEIPAMLIQPIVENAILHGLNAKKGDKNLTIEFKLKNKNLECLVTDNGVGVNATKSKPDLNRQKYGLKLAKDRIKLINESYQTKAEINIIDLSDLNDTKTGTRVIISMPLKY